MQALVQRVRRAAVRIDGKIHSEIGPGLLVFLGVEKADDDQRTAEMVRKLSGFRIFNDDEGKMNLSCEDVAGEYLVVSQFTLAADCSRGKRPGFENAMKPPRAEEIYEDFCARLRSATGRPVKTGSFGAMMLVEIENDGPVTFLLKVDNKGN